MRRAGVRLRGDVKTDIGYTSQREDVSINLMFYRARFYAPSLGRFVSADTLVPDGQNPQQFNRYAYTVNNPLKYTDPSGHCIFGLDTIVCAIAAAVGAYLARAAVESVVDTAIDYGISQATGEEFDVGVSFASNFAVNALTAGIGGDVKHAAKAADLAVTAVKHTDEATDAIRVIGKADLPRMTDAQFNGLDKLAKDSGCMIVICGGYAENAVGIENRTIAYRLNRGKDVGPVPGWRNTGPPSGKDLDYWTPQGTVLPDSVMNRMSELFPGVQIDNYSQWRPPRSIPTGSVTFLGNGQAVRYLTSWQKPYNWKK